MFIKLIVKLKVDITSLTNVREFPNSRNLKKKDVDVYLFVDKFLSIRLLLIVIIEFVFVNFIQMMI